MTGEKELFFSVIKRKVKKGGDYENEELEDCIL
jgi:hypothetical protein